MTILEQIGIELNSVLLEENENRGSSKEETSVFITTTKLMTDIANYLHGAHHCGTNSHHHHSAKLGTLHLHHTTFVVCEYRDGAVHRDGIYGVQSTVQHMLGEKATGHWHVPAMVILDTEMVMVMVMVMVKV